MRKFIRIIFILLPNISFSQNLPVILTDTVEMQSVTVTATKTKNFVKDIPLRVEIISEDEIELLPANNTDDLLRMLTGLNIDRQNGIYSKNSSITMRGVNGAQRALVLIDGVPMNKTDGGSVNWSRIDPESVEKIEVVKGPLSALYGGNGMSGVINIITQSPYEKQSTSLSASYGTYNTMGGKFRTGFSEIKNDKGFFGSIYGFYRRGDGYIIYPDSIADTFNIKTYLYEYLISGRVGYAFNKTNRIEVEYDYYDDKRGDGKKFYDEDGGYYKYTTNFIRANYVAKYKGWGIVANGFMQMENYLQHKESVKIEKTLPYAVTGYQLYDAGSFKKDIGLWMNAVKNINKHNDITAGVDFKTGSVNAADVYYSSSDSVINQGRMNFYALYLRDQLKLLKNHVNVIVGLRGDYVTFCDGYFGIEEPSSANLYISDFNGYFNDTAWYSVSPQISVQYSFNKFGRLYFSAGQGFRPPILDDMCRNGAISKGFKLANPYLIPEKLNNYELGFDVKLFKKLDLNTTLFYSEGNDFQYFVGNGDSVFSGNKLKPVLQRQNIGQAEIYGAEVSVNYVFTKKIKLIANYAYYHSTIRECEQEPSLVGMMLMEVAPNQVNAYLLWKNKYFNASVAYHYKDPQWTDDFNTVQANGYSLIDCKIGKNFFNKLYLSLSVQDVMNNVYIDEKDIISPGRFFITEVKWSIK